MNLNTRPAEAPLFGSFKVEMHVFKWDIRLGIAKMHMNQQGVGLDVGQIKFPQMLVIERLPYTSNEYILAIVEVPCVGLVILSRILLVLNGVTVRIVLLLVFPVTASTSIQLPL